MSQFDLIVVGGGCNGTGIARDAAMRGLKVLLLEKNDFSAGTTGASSGMIHGGPRYMLYEVKTTKLACEDARHILKIARHLCFRIPFLVPIAQEGKSKWTTRLNAELVETFFEAYDRFSPLKGGKPHTRLSREETFQLEPCLVDDVVGGVTFDEWGIDTARLCVLNALSARDAGAEVKNHTEVIQVLKENDAVVGVRTRHVITGEENEYRCRILFNATGPWLPQFAAMAGIDIQLRPGKGIHLILDRRITNVAIVSKCVDGRQIFINPHENNTLIGTTDDDYYGELEDIPVSEDEIEYLLQGMERIYPDIRQSRIISTWRGVRPTLWGQDVYEDELSREHEVFDHETRDGLKGFLSMGGGKLASYRVMAEEATDLICKKLNQSGVCKTHEQPLPGAANPPEPKEIAKKFDIHPYVARRLIARHGDEAAKVLAPTLAKPEEKAIVCTVEPTTAAEIRYAFKHEMAESISDAMRRTRVAQGSCQGTECLLPAIGIMAEERALDADGILAETSRFLEQSWRARKSILSESQLAQEEVLQWIYRGTLKLQHFKKGMRHS